MASLAGGEEVEWTAVIRSDLVQRRSIVGDEPKIELLYHWWYIVNNYLFVTQWIRL